MGWAVAARAAAGDGGSGWHFRMSATAGSLRSLPSTAWPVGSAQAVREVKGGLPLLTWASRAGW